MKIILSRKGFDQGSGGAPSPIIEGRPISLPIPATRHSHTTYNDLELGKLVEKITKEKINGEHLCHHDPQFEGHRCAFGQSGTAQSHLAKQGVGEGDVFLFFGLFSEENIQLQHHRIFGYLRVKEIRHLGAAPKEERIPGFKGIHPHMIGEWSALNTLYIGEGGVAGHASKKLCLTAEDEKRKSIWSVPSWLEKTNLSYHKNEERWLSGNKLKSVARGQEFVADIDKLTGLQKRAADKWLLDIIEEIKK